MIKAPGKHSATPPCLKPDRDDNLIELCRLHGGTGHGEAGTGGLDPLPAPRVWVIAANPCEASS
jgi:hypothetical protein